MVWGAFQIGPFHLIYDFGIFYEKCWTGVWPHTPAFPFEKALFKVDKITLAFYNNFITFEYKELSTFAQLDIVK
jgi:hypothetical protein